MATAYVLINCDLGFEEQIIEELKHLSDVREAHEIFGAYDIPAKVESDQISTLRKTIMCEIRKIGRVRSTFNIGSLSGCHSLPWVSHMIHFYLR